MCSSSSRTFNTTALCPLGGNDSPHGGVEKLVSGIVPLKQLRRNFSRGCRRLHSCMEGGGGNKALDVYSDHVSRLIRLQRKKRTRSTVSTGALPTQCSRHHCASKDRVIEVLTAREVTILCHVRRRARLHWRLRRGRGHLRGF